LGWFDRSWGAGRAEADRDFAPGFDSPARRVRRAEPERGDAGRVGKIAPSDDPPDVRGLFTALEVDDAARRLPPAGGAAQRKAAPDLSVGGLRGPRGPCGRGVSLAWIASRSAWASGSLAHSGGGPVRAGLLLSIPGALSSRAGPHRPAASSSQVNRGGGDTAAGGAKSARSSALWATNSTRRAGSRAPAGASIRRRPASARSRMSRARQSASRVEAVLIARTLPCRPPSESSPRRETRSEHSDRSGLRYDFFPGGLISL
jgi:hypothetical protein